MIDPDLLFEAVRKALSSGKYSDASVGVVYGDEVLSGIVREDVTRLSTPDSVVDLGCIAKLFTSSLLRGAIRDGLFEIDSPLESLLDDEVPKPVAAGITIRQLFNHAHGLDDSTIRVAPIRADGFVDVDKLCRLLSIPSRLAKPGRFYSYGEGSGLLAAAVLENKYRMKYAEVLSEQLLSPLGIHAAWYCDHQCLDMEREGPTSAGATLTVSMAGLLRFLHHQIRDCDRGFLDPDRTAFTDAVMPLPGWHSIEKGICFGWKYYGEGWFGHNSEKPLAGALLRVNARQRLGIVISTCHRPPTAVASALFRECWPSMLRMETPKMVFDKCFDRQNAARYVGQYSNSELSYFINLGTTGSLLMSYAGTGQGVQTKNSAVLHPAQEEIFLLNPPLAGLSPFVQFICPEGGGFDYLWTGSRVLRCVRADRKANL